MENINGGSSEIKRRQHHKEFEEMMIKVDDIINNKNYISDDSAKSERAREIESEKVFTVQLFTKLSSFF